MIIQEKNYNGKRLVVDISIKRQGYYSGFVIDAQRKNVTPGMYEDLASEFDPVQISPKVFKTLPDWVRPASSGRPTLGKEKLERRPVSLQPELWKRIDERTDTPRKLIQRALAQYLDIDIDIQ